MVKQLPKPKLVAPQLKDNVSGATAPEVYSVGDLVTVHLAPEVSLTVLLQRIDEVCFEGVVEDGAHEDIQPGDTVSFNCP